MSMIDRKVCGQDIMALINTLKRHRLLPIEVSPKVIAKIEPEYFYINGEIG